MKIIITENQLKEVILNETIGGEIMAQLSQTNDPATIMDYLASALSDGIIGFSNIPFILSSVFDESPEGEAQKHDIFQRLRSMLSGNNVQNNRMMAQDGQLSEKVEAVKEYMATAAKNRGYRPENIKITPERMVNACVQKGFDLPLLMAQAHLESCFGLTPRARKTNSVFSVGSYDNGKNARTYPTQDDSIIPYIELMQNNFLRGRSVADLLRPGAFVNGANKRYATDLNYESKVRNIRNRIIKAYPILAS